ncbi:MAG: DUF5666 domain-containing protein [Anaerolineales bacterium]|jgi:hypothetical protein
MFQIIRSRSAYVVALGAAVLGLGFPATAHAQTAGPETRFDVAGEITAVASGRSSFELNTVRGESLTIATDQDTHFRSLDGSLQSVNDLAPGMKAFAVGSILSDGTYLARQVGAGSSETVKHRLVRKRGEISSIVPGQSTFELQSAEGDLTQFHVTERTRFFSRDQSVSNIHDLKKGMPARVAALVHEDGTLEAIVVTVAPEAANHPGTGVDVRLAGHIVDLGDQSLVVKTFEGEQLTVAVNDKTVYRSVQNRIQGFGDLRTGMLVAVGAKENGDQLTAAWIAAGRVRPSPEAQGRRSGPAGGTELPRGPSLAPPIG